MTELLAEQQRHRGRLHNLEGLVGSFVEAQRENRRGEARQYRSLELRLQVLTVVIAIAAIAVPLVLAILNGK